jgi:hypothetical protein
MDGAALEPIAFKAAWAAVLFLGIGMSSSHALTLRP